MPNPMQPHAWREVIGHWTTAMRQEWGELANAKQDAGATWQDAEREAFWAIGDQFTYDPEDRSYRPVKLDDLDDDDPRAERWLAAFNERIGR
jgi:hypothetical protein